MSTTVRTLRAVLTAEDAGMTRTLAKVETALGGVSAAMTALQGLAVYAVAKGTFDFIAGSVKEFAEAEQGAAKFRATIKNLGVDVQAATARATAFATSLSRESLFTDDAILGAEQLLASIGRLTGDGLERATKAAADLATGLGVDLETAARALARAASGSTEALGRYGIEGKTFAEILGNIESKFGGVAKAATDTTAGGLAQLSKEFGELKEAIGGAAASSGLLALLTSLTEQLRAFNDAANEGSLFKVLQALNPMYGYDKFNTLEKVAQLAQERSNKAAGITYQTNPQFPTFPRAENMTGGPAKIAADSAQASAAVQQLTQDVIALEVESFNFTPRPLVNTDFIFSTNVIDETQRVWQDIEEMSRQYESQITTIADAEKNRRVAIARMEASQRVQLATQMMSDVAALIPALFGQSKGAAIAQAIINTSLAATRALAEYPPPWSFVMAAAQIAAGMVQVEKIRSTNFTGYALGGIIPGFDTGKDTVPIMARPGEAVLPKELTDALLRGGGGVTVNIVGGDLANLVKEINTEVRRGNLRLSASDVRTTGLVR